MNVKKILKKLNIKKKCYNYKIKGVSGNSKNITSNYVFVAIKGARVNGHNYIEEAIENGANTIFYEEKIIIRRRGINYIKVESTKKILAEIVKIYYKDITKKIKIIGITGTNGKTTTTTIIHQFLTYQGKRSLLIGTNGIYHSNESIDTMNTTPDILTIIRHMALAVKKRYQYCVMEISSHAINELRVYGIDINIVVFTNISHDHLDYHKTMEQYRNTKGRIFSSLKDWKSNYIILNRDDDNFKYFYEISKAKIITYSITNNSMIMAYDIVDDMETNSFKVLYDNYLYKIKSNLIATFNVYNILASFAVVTALRLDIREFITFIKMFQHVPGRMEMIKHHGSSFIIDYAHTPDSVNKVLQTIKDKKPKILTTIIGCGGCRDKQKREIIGKISTNLSDHVIFTNDNPRDEEPTEIINDILKGVTTDNYEIILSRKEAIKVAVERSKKNEVVAILGRGNEKIQKLGARNIHFEDSEWLRKCLKMVY